jgi:hypothetical protein
MSTHSAFLLAHVVAGTLLIARSIVATEVRLALLAARTLPVLRTWTEFGLRAARSSPPLALAVLLTGLYLGAGGWWREPWFHVAAAAWILDAMLAVTIVQPAHGALMDVAARSHDPAISPDVDARRASRTWSIAVAVMSGTDLSMLYVMFEKPGYVAATLAVVGTTLVFAAIQAVRAARLPAATPPRSG